MFLSLFGFLEELCNVDCRGSASERGREDRKQPYRQQSRIHLRVLEEKLETAKSRLQDTLDDAERNGLEEVVTNLTKQILDLESSVASFRLFRSPRAWASRASFHSGSTCCALAIENCGPLAA